MLCAVLCDAGDETGGFHGRVVAVSAGFVDAGDCGLFADVEEEGDEFFFLHFEDVLLVVEDGALVVESVPFVCCSGFPSVEDGFVLPVVVCAAEDDAVLDPDEALFE